MRKLLRHRLFNSSVVSVVFSFWHFEGKKNLLKHILRHRNMGSCGTNILVTCAQCEVSQTQHSYLVTQCHQRGR